MRFTLLVSAFALTAIPTAAFAQEQVRTPSEFVCELVGDECADGTTPEQQADPAAPTVAGGRAARVSGKARGFVLAKPVDPTRVVKPTVATTKVTKSGRDVVGGAGITMPPVDLRLGFTTGSTALVGRELQEVRSFAAALNSPKLAGRKVRIEGHTDSVGSRASNLALSQQRAQAVVRALIAEGVDASRIEAAGYGPDRPLPGRPASAGANRRVEAVLVK